MAPAAKLVTDLFMMVLCIYVMPPDKEDLRIDLINADGYVDTMIVRRADDGFIIYDGIPGETDEVVPVRPLPEEGTFQSLRPDGKETVIRLPDVLDDLAKLKSPTVTHMDLQAKDGTEIKYRQSGGVAYLTIVQAQRTYAAHR